MRIEGPFRRLLNVFIILFVVVSGTLVYWQVSQAQTLTASAYNPRHCVVGTVPQRGTIYDRKGVKLAWSVTDPGSPCGWRRHYADPSLAPVIGYFDPQGFGVTGLEAAYDNVLSGQQSAAPLQDITTGLQNTISSLEHARTFGNDVYLTIDERIQQFASQTYNPGQQYCDTRIETTSQRGSILVEDPHTGEMLAMVSHPGFDADKLVNHAQAPDGAIAPDGTPLTVGQEYWNQLLSDPDKPLIDRPISDILVPGSSFKTYTLIAALDSGVFQTTSAFDQADATDYVVDGFDINSNNLFGSPTFPLDLVHNYAYSNNVVFARVSTKLGNDTWLSYANRFGISYGSHVANIPFDLPVTHSWIYRPGVGFDQVALANAGYGQATLQISPMVETIMVSAVAADGAYYAPHLQLKAVPYGTDAKSVQNNAPQLLAHVMSSDAARGVREAMRAVVLYGSIGGSGGPIGAAQTAVDTNGTPILEGGKTGTGQIATGKYSETWYASLAPDDTANPTANPPKLTVLVQKEEDGEGACQAPIAAKIYQMALPLVG